ncbi:MAG: glucose-6-phosphate dehydrogenase, partial [Nitrospirales bacterium]
MSVTHEACVMVVFGADGDLTKRKLIPSLYNLAASRHLPKEFAVVGLARTPLSTDEFRAKLTRDIKDFATVPVDPSLWKWFSERLYYVTGDFRDPHAYRTLQETLLQVDARHGTEGSYMFYLATAPSFFAEIVRQLSIQGLTSEHNGCWRRVVIEKPFGHDLASARALNRELQQTLSEGQIYR